MTLKEIIGEELFYQLPAQKQIEFHNQDLKDISKGEYISKSEFDNELKFELQELALENKKNKSDFEAKLKAIEFSNALDKTLFKYGEKKAKLIEILLEKDKLTLKDGKIEGLEEQLKTIQLENDFLFEVEGAVSTDMISGIEENKECFATRLAKQKSEQIKNIDNFFK